MWKILNFFKFFISSVWTFPNLPSFCSINVFVQLRSNFGLKFSTPFSKHLKFLKEIIFEITSRLLPTKMIQRSTGDEKPSNIHEKHVWKINCCNFPLKKKKRKKKDYPISSINKIKNCHKQVFSVNIIVHKILNSLKKKK